MGLVKQQWMEEQERGWSSCEDKFVCDKCVRDEFLQNLVKSEALAESCDFCDRQADEPIAAPADTVMEVVGAAFYSVYTDPVHVASYNSREGGYLVPTTDTDDAVEGLFRGVFSDDFHQLIVDSISGSTWIVCDVEPYRLSDGEVLALSWRDFVEYIKHRSRYFFTTPVACDEINDETIHPAQFLDRLSRMISDSELFHETEDPWFRARVHKPTDRVDSGGTLGTPPYAPFSNRMSPAGICMFYGASERDTAIAEVLDPNRTIEDRAVTSGAFKPSRPLRVLDLRRIPSPPSFFDLERRDEYIVRHFLLNFVADLAKPVSKSGTEHIEYVPTQVVTEFFRMVYRDDDRPLDGIVFTSSRDGGACCVLFFKNEQCVDDDDRTERSPFVEEDWLVLDCATLETRELG